MFEDSDHSEALRAKNFKEPLVGREAIQARMSKNPGAVLHHAAGND